MSKLSFIVSAWGDRRPKALPVVLASLTAQTMQDWDGIVVDTKYTYEHFFWAMKDRRMGYTVGEGNIYQRSELGMQVRHGQWLCFPNDDAYYVPVFAQRMIQHAEANALDLVYCDFVDGKPERGYFAHSAAPHVGEVDKTCFIVRRSVMPARWPKREEEYQIADGRLVEWLVSNGVKHGRLADLLVVHN